MLTQYDVTVFGMAPRVSDLIAMAKEQRRHHIGQFFHDLVEASEETRRAAIYGLITAQSALSPDEYRSMTASRLFNWIHMPLPEAAKLAESWDAAMQTQKVDVAMREVGVMQSLLSDYTNAQQARLRTIIPERVLGPATQSLSETLSEGSGSQSSIDRFIDGINSLFSHDDGRTAAPSG